MGRKNHRYKKKKNQETAYDGANPKQPYQVDFTSKTVEQGNFKMEAYYALQGMHDYRFNDEGTLVACETAEEKNAERLRWRQAISTILPASFRTAYDISEPLKEKLESELEALITNQKKEAAATKEENEKEVTSTPDNTEIVKKLSFLPHAYQLNTDRKFIRKDPTMKKLHNWLRQQTDSGFITRQETVSMVPPVVLAPQPDDIILDMCAAPGSKTCQILEKLSVKGAMIANDSSSQRACMLVSQLRRIMHNNPVVMVTSCDAQFFPQTLMFDRILTDVPCSGDGTSRKNIGIWKNWNQLGALALHNLQLDIAWKGVALLKAGGYMCYSTCSHNPIENEAVVAELLRRSNGSLELVDTPLEGFKVRPGITTWKVLAEEKSNRQMKDEAKKNNAKMRQRRADWEQKEKEKTAAAEGNGKAVKNENLDNVLESTGETEVSEGSMDADAADDGMPDFTTPRPKFVPPVSWDEESLIQLAQEAGLMHFKTLDDVPKNALRKRIKSSCFPPTDEEVTTMHLEKCIRCLPQDNDTGGFFVALLKKTASISRRETKCADRSSADGDNDKSAADVASDDGPAAKKMKPNGDQEDETTDSAMVTGETESNGEDNPPKEQRSIKRNFVSNSKGRKHTDLGRDDFVPVDLSVFESMREYYGFTDSFPQEQYMARAGGAAKVIHYLGKSVKDNFIDAGLQKRVTIIGSGVKGFVRNTNKDTTAPYRISQEGIHFLLPHMTKRKVAIEEADFLACMAGDGKTILLATFSDAFNAIVQPLSSGPFVATLKGYESNNMYARKLALVMWRCRNEAVNCLVNKTEVESMKSKVASLKEEGESLG